MTWAVGAADAPERPLARGAGLSPLLPVLVADVDGILAENIGELHAMVDAQGIRPAYIDAHAAPVAAVGKDTEAPDL